MQKSEEWRGTDASMREVQGLVDGDVDMVDGEREEHFGMDMDGPAPGEDSRFGEDEDEEEEIHRPVVKSTPNGSLSSGKKVPATSSPSKPPSAAAKPTAGKSLVKLVPIAIHSKTPIKNKAQAKEPSRSFLLTAFQVWSPHKSPVNSAPASPIRAAQVKLAEKEEEVIPTKLKSGPTSQKKTSTRTHEAEEENKVQLSLSQRRVRRTSR